MFTKRARIPFYEVTIPERDYEIDELFRNAKIQNTSSSISDVDVTRYLNKLNSKQDYLFSDILKDSGKGRVSTGLRSLELLSRLCAGADQSKLFLFDNVMYVSSPLTVRNASTDELYKIIYTNLGMSDIISNLPESQLSISRKLFLEIGNLVKSGNFQKENYRFKVLSECKRLTKVYIGLK